MAPSLSDGFGERYAQFLESYERERQEHDPSIVSEIPNSRASRTYDAVFAVAHAVRISLMRGEKEFKNVLFNFLLEALILMMVIS